MEGINLCRIKSNKKILTTGTRVQLCNLGSHQQHDPEGVAAVFHFAPNKCRIASVSTDRILHSAPNLQPRIKAL